MQDARCRMGGRMKDTRYKMQDKGSEVIMNRESFRHFQRSRLLNCVPSPFRLDLYPLTLHHIPLCRIFA